MTSYVWLTVGKIVVYLVSYDKDDTFYLRNANIFCTYGWSTCCIDIFNKI